VVTTTIRLRFDRRSTPIRIHLDRATTIRRPTLRTYGAIEIRLLLLLLLLLNSHVHFFQELSSNCRKQWLGDRRPYNSTIGQLSQVTYLSIYRPQWSSGQRPLMCYVTVTLVTL